MRDILKKNKVKPPYKGLEYLDILHNPETYAKFKTLCEQHQIPLEVFAKLVETARKNVGKERISHDSYKDILSAIHLDDDEVF